MIPFFTNQKGSLDFSFIALRFLSNVMIMNTLHLFFKAIMLHNYKMIPFVFFKAIVF
jgi:hypothetical protein